MKEFKVISSSYVCIVKEFKVISSLYVCMVIKYIIVLFVETPCKFITASNKKQERLHSIYTSNTHMFFIYLLLQ